MFEHLKQYHPELLSMLTSWHLEEEIVRRMITLLSEKYYFIGVSTSPLFEAPFAYLWGMVELAEIEGRLNNRLSDMITGDNDPRYGLQFIWDVRAQAPVQWSPGFTISAPSLVKGQNDIAVSWWEAQ